MIYILGAGSVSLRIAQRIQDGSEKVKIVTQYSLYKSSEKHFMPYEEFREQASDKDSLIICWRLPYFNEDAHIASSTLAFLESGKRNFSRVIYLSSGSVYGNGSDIFSELSPPDPKNDYAKNKFSLEQWCVETFKSDLAILRISNVFGDSKVDDFINRVIKAWKFEQTLTLYDINHFSRDYISIDEVSEIVFNLGSSTLTRWRGLQYYNVSSNSSVTNGEIISMLKKLSPKKNVINSIDVPEGIPLKYQLNNKKILKLFPSMLIDSRNALERYFQEHFDNISSESKVESNE